MTSVRPLSSIKASFSGFRWPRLRLPLVAGWFALFGAVQAAEEAQVALTPVTADHGDFDGSGTTHLLGNVDVNIPGFLHLQCDDLVGEIPEDAAAATNVNLTVSGNVKIYITARRGTNPPIELVATGGRGVYTGTNQLFVLTENPRIVTEKGTLSGERIEYNLGNDQAVARPFRFVPNAQSLTNLFKLKRPRKPASLP